MLTTNQLSNLKKPKEKNPKAKIEKKQRLFLKAGFEKVLLYQTYYSELQEHRLSCKSLNSRASS